MNDSNGVSQASINRTLESSPRGLGMVNTRTRTMGVLWYLFAIVWRCWYPTEISHPGLVVCGRSQSSASLSQDRDQ